LCKGRRLDQRGDQLHSSLPCCCSYGNIFADSGLFALGILRSTDSVLPPARGSTEIEDNYRSLGRDLYGEDIKNSLSSSISTKTAEIFNLSATVTSCSTMKPGEYNRTDVRHRHFHELAAKCAEMEILIWKEDHAARLNHVNLWLSEFVTQYWLSMCYRLRDIYSLTAILLFLNVP
jgi:hypothetical protein